MQAVTERDLRFWDKIADKYAASPISDQEGYERKLEITRKYLTRDSEVFEFGCGTGSTAILHSPHVKHILATDVAENMLGIGRRRVAEAGVSNITFERAGIEDFHSQGRQFDVVLGLNVIHLCRDPLGVMRKAHALLRPGGHFVQSTVCLKDLKAFFKYLIPTMQMIGKAPFVQRHMSSADLHRYLHEAGFRIVEEWCPGGKQADFIVATPRS